jgi:hypothetical protein
MPGKIIDQIVFCGENLSVDVAQIMKAFGDTPRSCLKVDDRKRASHQAFRTLKVGLKSARGSKPTPLASP